MNSLIFNCTGPWKDRALYIMNKIQSMDCTKVTDHGIELAVESVKVTQNCVNANVHRCKLTNGKEVKVLEGDPFRGPLFFEVEE